MEIAGAEIEWMQQQVQQTNHGTKYECWKNNCCHNKSHYNKKKQKWLSYCISSLWFLTSNRQNGIDVSTSESWFYRIHQLTFHRNCTWTGLPWPPYIILHDLRACRDVQRMLVTFTERRLFGQFSVCMVLAACCYWLQSEDGFLLQYLATYTTAALSIISITNSIAAIFDIVVDIVFTAVKMQCDITIIWIVCDGWQRLMKSLSLSLIWPWH